jgi:hypothetical protein
MFPPSLGSIRGGVGRGIPQSPVSYRHTIQVAPVFWHNVANKRRLPNRFEGVIPTQPSQAGKLGVDDNHPPMMKNNIMGMQITGVKTHPREEQGIIPTGLML